MKELFVALLIVTLLYWNFNIRRCNNCIAIKEEYTNIQVDSLKSCKF